MALTDIHFSEGDAQNFILETPTYVSPAPEDILTEGNSNAGALCEEVPQLVTPGTSPDMIMLSDGKLAKRASDTFYIKL